MQVTYISRSLKTDPQVNGEGRHSAYSIWLVKWNGYIQNNVHNSSIQMLNVADYIHKHAQHTLNLIVCQITSSLKANQFLLYPDFNLDAWKVTQCFGGLLYPNSDYVQLHIISEMYPLPNQLILEYPVFA